MKRRTFIVGLGSVAALPVVARAQQGERMRRIGVLMAGNENDPARKPRLSALTQALADFGWTDGRNVRMDVRWTGGDTNRTRALAQYLVGLQPDTILTGGTPTTVAVQRARATIPIVFANATDPVASGVVPRLERPGGNVTGFAFVESSLGGKWVELLSEIAPGLKRAAIMFNPDNNPVSAYMPSFDTAARSLNVVPITAPVHSDVEIDTAIVSLGCEPGDDRVIFSVIGFHSKHSATQTIRPCAPLSDPRGGASFSSSGKWVVPLLVAGGRHLLATHAVQAICARTPSHPSLGIICA